MDEGSNGVVVATQLVDEEHSAVRTQRLVVDVQSYPALLHFLHILLLLHIAISFSYNQMFLDSVSSVPKRTEVSERVAQRCLGDFHVKVHVVFREYLLIV